jgi:glycine dehydrogenase subunit 1
MADYTPHTDDEIAAMLGFVGLDSLDQLFDVVPEALRLTEPVALAPGAPEPDVLAHLEDLAAANRPVGRELVCFAGAGAYDHHVPPVTRALAGRSEFVTSYTPYQAEVAQGVLQAVFEFQSLVSRLSGLAVANASLYDGASATVEAVNLAVGATGRSTVWLSSGLPPNWRQVVRTLAAGPGHRIVDVPLTDGRTDWSAVAGAAAMPGTALSDAAMAPDEAPAAVVVASPNHLGCLEDLAGARRLCDRTGALLVVAFDPVAAAVLRSPGDVGADVAVAEGQPLGMPLSFGGPYLGLFACRREHVRRLPGRLVGETVDGHGQRAYVTTLRTREQDIRREKATSNVCTNQTLMAVTAAIQLGWLGTSGLAEVARRCAQGTRYCRDQLLAIDGVEPLVGAPVFREFAVHLPRPAATVVDRLLDDGILAGVVLDETHAPDGHGLLVAVTERRTRRQIDELAAALDKAVR